MVVLIRKLITKKVNLAKHFCMKTAELRNKVHEIIDSNDDEIIRAVYILLQASTAENVLGESVEKYNEELEKAERCIDQGQFITHGDVKRQIKNW